MFTRPTGYKYYSGNGCSDDLIYLYIRNRLSFLVFAQTCLFLLLRAVILNSVYCQISYVKATSSLYGPSPLGKTSGHTAGICNLGRCV